MKRSFALVVVALLATLLAGCVTRGYAGQENAGASAGGQAANSTPLPQVVEPKEQGAAGETPSMLGRTPESGQVEAWEHHRFFDVWDIGYPNGWTVDRPGTGEVVLSGAYGGHEYRVEVARPANAQAKDLPSWVQSDLEQINQAGAPRQEASIKDVPAMKVTNLKLQGQAQRACPAVRVYARTDKLKGDQNYLVMTVSQTDKSACDAANLDHLADALMAEMKS
jgi:predicted small secreted protein